MCAPWANYTVGAINFTAVGPPVPWLNTNFPVYVLPFQLPYYAVPYVDGLNETGWTVIHYYLEWVNNPLAASAVVVKTMSNIGLTDNNLHAETSEGMVWFATAFISPLTQTEPFFPNLALKPQCTLQWNATPNIRLFEFTALNNNTIRASGNGLGIAPIGLANQQTYYRSFVVEPMPPFPHWSELFHCNSKTSAEGRRIWIDEPRQIQPATWSRN